MTVLAMAAACQAPSALAEGLLLLCVLTSNSHLLFSTRISTLAFLISASTLA